MNTDDVSKKEKNKNKRVTLSVTHGIVYTGLKK